MGRLSHRAMVVIQEEECTGCGICLTVCPAGCLSPSGRFNQGGYPTVSYAGSGCRGDGRCTRACPERGAITVIRLPAAA